MLPYLFLLATISLTQDLYSQDFKALIQKATKSPYVGQGNPSVTKHPVSKEQCLKSLKDRNIDYYNKEFETICGSPYMAPLYNPSTEKPQDAKACIDQFEFPNQPCEYPVIWVRANEAQNICELQGKRLCDAHEWEGACDGQLLPPDYDFSLVGPSTSATIKKRRLAHNRKTKQQWAYGSTRKKGICAANSFKSKDCNGGNWKKCGSNTYPSGYFPQCRSKLGVYDQHGNAAEHMNLPVEKSEMLSAGGKPGHTEMKGSWFIFDKYYAHQDWCRWRAPYWHGTKVMHPKSHHNYHLGFRCCKTLKK